MLHILMSFFMLFSSAIFAFLPPMAYVCDLGTNAVSVIDTSTNHIVATIPVGISPGTSALTPDGAYLYVVNSGEYSLSVIDAIHNTLYITISLPSTGGSYPQDIAITPDGKYAYVTISGDNTTNNLTVIDIASNTAIEVISFPFDSIPVALAITPDGKYAYVLAVDNNLYVISTETNSIIENLIGVFSSPYDIIFSSDGKYAYISNLGVFHTITVVNTGTYEVSSIDLTDTASGAAVGGLCISPNGFYIYTLDVNNPYVYVVDTRTNETVASILTPFGALQAIAMTPDGNYTYFSGNYGVDPGIIGIIHTESNQMIGTITIPAVDGQFPSPVGITITPLLPPSSFSGVQKINKFGIVQEHFNALSWEASVSEIDGYILTRNGQFLTTLPSTATSHQDHNRPLYQNAIYTLRAFNKAGSVSYAPLTIVNYKK